MSWNQGLRLRLSCNTLRIDATDGSPVTDYRIENGNVELRTHTTPSDGGTVSEGQWERLTPAQLSSHVLAGTVLAQWLTRRLGVHSLVRACNESC